MCNWKIWELGLASDLAESKNQVSRNWSLAVGLSALLAFVLLHSRAALPLVETGWLVEPPQTEATHFLCYSCKSPRTASHWLSVGHVMVMNGSLYQGNGSCWWAQRGSCAQIWNQGVESAPPKQTDREIERMRLPEMNGVKREMHSQQAKAIGAALPTLCLWLVVYCVGWRGI